jgi:hypothetical protein
MNNQTRRCSVQVEVHNLSESTGSNKRPLYSKSLRITAYAKMAQGGTFQKQFTHNKETRENSEVGRTIVFKLLKSWKRDNTKDES